MFVFTNKVSRSTSTRNCYHSANSRYDLTRYGQIKSKQIVASLGVGDSPTAFHESYQTRIIVIYYATFSKLAQQD